ncbi:esterase family protein [Kocuria sp.]|uniref:alpha/beta hydrolase n=1 Tax=Kocuria sp. TaxID=1871328 RepID=UPI0026DC143F|nr:alpha/beta hydrolase-fold protein [Kocuria sp.]MDO4919132.1 alpha/beta hydrolase-fold protein [Kocuria sp.]
MDFFELTSWPLFITVTVAAVLLLAYTVLALPRKRRPGVGKYLVQLVCVVLVVVLALAGIFLKMNMDNQWYSSWGDLFSDGGGPVTTASAGAAPAAVTALRELPHRAFSSQQTRPVENASFGSQLDPGNTSGQWVSFTIAGERSGITQEATAWLPPSYMAHPERSYPVITAFTGFPGDVRTYTKAMDIAHHIRAAVSDGSMRESIVVIPDVYPGNNDTECVDSTHGRWETYVSQDVVSWIRDNLRVSTDRRAWSTLGYSAGGWCSSMFTVRHPEIWATSVNLAGYFRPMYTPGQQWKTADPRAYDLAGIVRREKPDVHIWFFSGGEDSISVKAVKAFAPAVSAPTSLVSNVSQSGGHRVALWEAQLSPALQWLGRTSPAFAAAPSQS